MGNLKCACCKKEWSEHELNTENDNTLDTLGVEKAKAGAEIDFTMRNLDQNTRTQNSFKDGETKEFDIKEEINEDTNVVKKEENLVSNLKEPSYDPGSIDQGEKNDNEEKDQNIEKTLLPEEIVLSEEEIKIKKEEEEKRIETEAKEIALKEEEKVKKVEEEKVKKEKEEKVKKEDEEKIKIEEERIKIEEEIKRKEEEAIKKEEEKKKKEEEKKRKEEEKKKKEEEKIQRKKEKQLRKEEDEKKRKELKQKEEESKPYKFKLLNSHPEEFEKEKKLAEEKKLIIERINFDFKLKNLNGQAQKKTQYLVELLYSNTENPNGFFSIGHTKTYTSDENMEINFFEEFEINYLFQRAQFLKFMIYSSDGKKSEITIDLANVMAKRLEPSFISVDLTLGSTIIYNDNVIDEKLPQLEINYDRTTKFLDNRLFAFYCDYHFYFVQTKAKRLMYRLVLEDSSNERFVLHKSNELFGKGPHSFAITHFEAKTLFEKLDVKNYLIEIYEGEHMHGRAALDRKEVEQIMTSGEPELIPFNVEKDPNQVSKPSWMVEEPMQNPKSLKLRPNKDGRSEAKKPTVKSPNRPDEKKSTSKVALKDGKLTVKRDDDKKKSVKGSPVKIQVNTVEAVKRDDEKSSSIKDNDGLNRSRRGSKQLIPDKSSKTLVKLEGTLGQVHLSLRQIERKKFTDYILDGLDINFETAIDYTSSNLDPRKPDSLHTNNIRNNKYVKAIRSCGNILQNYDTAQLFPVYGFGGVPKNNKEVSHCFHINGKKDPSIAGLDEVIEVYKTSLKEVEFVGPSYFQFILKNMIESVEKKMKKSTVLTYYVLLILTDGRVDDMDETKNALIEASKLPISVIIVGIGNGDFGKMNILGNIIYNI